MNHTYFSSPPPSSIWILREKELLQEISGMGELGGCWRTRQMDLLDKHLKLLKDYSQAKQNLQQAAHHNTHKFFRPSATKADEACEFAPINLHLQRMWAHNDTLKRSGHLDVVTVGAFTRHAGKTKTGGLIKLLQLQKDSPSKVDQNGVKVLAANDAVQAIKQLRKETVEIMSQLLCLAKLKNPKGMLPLCNDMVTKTRVLLNIWEPSLVEEAFAFIEQHRNVEETTAATAVEPDMDAGGTSMAAMAMMSPFRKITAQLGALDLKSPDLEDFATPMGPAPDLWPMNRTAGRCNASASGTTATTARAAPAVVAHKSPSTMDISAIASIQSSVQNYSRLMMDAASSSDGAGGEDDSAENGAPLATSSLPPEVGLRFSETHFDLNGAIETKTGDALSDEKTDAEKSERLAAATEAAEAAEAAARLCRAAEHMQQSRDEILRNSVDLDALGGPSSSASTYAHMSGAFLDTKAMSSSPSANYYRPTEEPEPLDLTQLNIEASVMCLVSKVKFLCGRCGSPAVRLRQPKQPVKRSGFGQQLAATPAPDLVDVAVPAVDSAAPAAMPTLALALSDSKKAGNKFTDGLDLSLTTDWAAELRPSMRKLRQAMDGLLKTARLMHSVQRLQQDMRRTSAHLATMYRRDVCFAQALTALVAALMAKLWGTQVTPAYVAVLGALGPLAYFEGLLSLYGAETDMWGDMCVAVEDVGSVRFTLVRGAAMPAGRDAGRSTVGGAAPAPRVVGSRHALTVLLPVPEAVFAALPQREATTFKVTPVFFNIGINEKATLSETLGYTREQHR